MQDSINVMANSRISKSTEITIFLIVSVFALVYINPFLQSSMEVSSLSAAVSIATRFDFEIDSAHKTLPGDFIVYKGKTYSMTPPGESWIAALLYTVFRPILTKLNDPRGEVEVLYVLCIIFASIPFAGLKAVLTYRIYRILNLDTKEAFWLCLLAHFSTMNFPYSTCFFKRHLSSFFLLLAFYLLMTAKHNGKAPVSRILSSGISSGFSVVINFPAGVLFPLFLFYLTSFIRPMIRATWILFGFLIGITPLLYANWRIFDDPFYLSYLSHHRSIPNGDVSTLSEFTHALFEQTIGSHAGYFFYAPIMIMAIYGMIKAKNYVAERLFIGAAFVVLLTLGSAWVGWAWLYIGVGPRFLLEANSFLCIPLCWAGSALYIQEQEASPRRFFSLPIAFAAISFFWSYASTVTGLTPGSARPLEYSLKVLASRFGSGVIFSDILPSIFGWETVFTYLRTPANTVWDLLRLDLAHIFSLLSAQLSLVSLNFCVVIALVLLFRRRGLPS